MKKRRLLFLAIGILFTIGTGCFNSERIAYDKPLKNLSVSQILERHDEQSAEWDWIGMRLDVTVENNGQRESFKASVRMARDSAIWMSISPALGVEVARIMLEPDTVLFISKVPGDKFYYTGNYEALEDWADTPMIFKDVQAVLGGFPMGLYPQQDKFNSKVDGGDYTLIGKYKRKIRRLVGVNDNHLEPEDSLNIQLPLRRYERLRNRTEDEDLLIKRYWFDGVTFDPVRDQFDDLYYQRSLTLERSDFEDFEGGRFPNACRVLIATVDGSATMEWEVMRIRFGRAYDFPFEIPEGYEQRTGF